VAHLARDEARAHGARPHDAGKRCGKGPRTRTLRIGQVEHHQVGRAAERGGGGRKAADESRILGAFEQIAGRIIAGMHQQIGTRHALRERARRCGALAERAAVGMRGGVEISGGDLGWLGIAPDQIGDPGPVSARRGAEDAREPADRGVGAARRRERIVRILLLAPRHGLHGGIKERDLGREQIAEQSGDAPGDVDARAPDHGERQHLDAGHPAAGVVPGRPASQIGDALGDLLAAGAQGGAAPQIDHERTRHLAMGLQVRADHLVRCERAQIHGGRGRQHAGIGGVEIASGRQHIAPPARRRAGRPGRNAAAIEGGEEGGAFGEGTVFTSP
jgi:hypothetical protein